MSAYYRFRYELNITQENLEDEFKKFGAHYVWSIDIDACVGDLIPVIASQIAGRLLLVKLNLEPLECNAMLDLLSELKSGNVNSEFYNIEFDIVPVEIENAKHFVSERVNNHWKSLCKKYKQKIV